MNVRMNLGGCINRYVYSARPAAATSSAEHTWQSVSRFRAIPWPATPADWGSPTSPERTSSSSTRPGCLTRRHRRPVSETGRVVAAQAGVLEHAPALLAVHAGPGQVVGHAPRDPR